MAPNEPHAKVDIIAPDGSVEDSVIVQFGYEQPLGIDPIEWTGMGYYGDEYRIELVYINTDGEHITGKTSESSEY